MSAAPRPVPSDAPDPHDAPLSLRLSSPAGLVAAVPGLLGFHPHDSAVLVAMSAGRVCVTLRLDLPDPADDDSSWAAAVVASVRRAAPHVDEAVMVIYPRECPPHRDLLPWRDLVDATEAALEARGLDLRDALCVTDRRWFSYRCTDDTCCDPEGEDLEGPEALRARSGMVLAGVAPLPDRSFLADELRPGPSAVIDLVSDLLRARSEELLVQVTGGRHTGDAAPADDEAIDDLALQAWREEAVGRLADLVLDGVSDEGDVAEVLLGLSDLRVRDTLLWELMQCPRADVWLRASQTLTDCVRSAPADCVAPVAAVLAVCAWQRGDGARAGAALDVALASDPRHSLALLVRHALTSGMPPQGWRDAMAAVSREQCLYGPAGRRPSATAPRRRRWRGR